MADHQSMLKLKESVEQYKEKFGKYSERIFADTIYRNRDNRNFCKENNIKLSGRPLGRPPKIKPLEKEPNDCGERNIVVSMFGVLKRK